MQKQGSGPSITKKKKKTFDPGLLIETPFWEKNRTTKKTNNLSPSGKGESQNKKESPYLKEDIKNEEDFGKFIDSIYNCDPRRLQSVLDMFSIHEIRNFVTKDDQYLKRAARELSYQSLAFLHDLGRGPLIRPKFTRSSEILKTFIQNLTTFKINKKKKKKILAVLLEFNESEVEEAVIQSRNSKLIKLMYAAKYAELSDLDDDYKDYTGYQTLFEDKDSKKLRDVSNQNVLDQSEKRKSIFDLEEAEIIRIYEEEEKDRERQKQAFIKYFPKKL